MQKRFFFKLFINFILFSFLNMTLAPAVEAMLLEASREGDAHLRRRALPLTGDIPEGAITFVPVQRQKLQGPTPKASLEVLSLDTSQIQELTQTFQKVRFPADPDFWVALSGFNEALRRREDLNLHTQRAIMGLSGAGAVLAGAAIAELFMFDGPVETLLGLPPYTPVPPIPGFLAGAGAAAGLLVIPDVYWTLKKGLYDYCRRSSQYDPLAREEDRGKSMGFAFVLGGIALFSGKEIFAFVTANIGAPTWLIPIIVVAGVPYVSLKLKSAYDIFQEGWDYFYRGAKHWILKKLGHRIAGEEAKKEIRTAFGKAFRKNLHDPQRALDLFISIQAVHSFVEEQSKAFLASLEALKKKHAIKTTSKQEREKLDLQIVQIEAEFLNVQRLGDLLVFKLMHDFGQDKPVASSAATSTPTEKDPDAPPRKRHPGWDYALRGSGIIIGGMASVTVWSGFNFMLRTFGAGDTISNTLASLLAPPMVAYLAKKWGDSFSRVFRFATNYNPIEAEKYISQPAVSYPRFRAVMEFLNLARSTYVNFPTSLVGGEGLYSVLNITTNVGYATLAPNMMAYGAALHEETRRRLTDMISGAHMRFGKKNWKENIKQWVANELFRASQWVEHLKGRNAILLREYMRKDPKEWFAASVPADLAPQPPVRAVDVTGIGDEVASTAVPTDLSEHTEHVSRDGRGEGAPVKAAPDTADVSGVVITPLTPSDVASEAVLASTDLARVSPVEGDSPPALPQPPVRQLPPLSHLPAADIVIGDIPLQPMGESRSDSKASLLGAADSSSPQKTLEVLPSHGPKRWAIQALQYLKQRSTNFVEEVVIDIASRVSPFARSVPTSRLPHVTPRRQEVARTNSLVVDQLKQPLLADQPQ